jgi:hypothetical protein
MAQVYGSYDGGGRLQQELTMSNPHPPVFHFTVDGRPFDTEFKQRTGAEIKAQAGVNPTYQLFEEGPGHSHDRPISDGDTVNLEGQEKHFYSVPPATFGTK